MPLFGQLDQPRLIIKPKERASTLLQKKGDDAIDYAPVPFVVLLRY
jgi:hypothetical protein